MANANITYVQLVNTFNEWRAATNDLIDDRNILRNHPYVKDNGTFTIYSTVNTAALLTVGSAGNGNVFVSNVLNASTVNANSMIVNRDLLVYGNLTVEGTSTTLNVSTLEIEDFDIVLNANTTGSPTNNSSITVDRGTSSNTFLRWNENIDRWGWSDDGTVMYNFVSALDAYAQANTARDTANNAYGQANLAYAQANTARDTANDAYGQANNAYASANLSYAQANTARTTANDAYAKANSSSNTARVSANGGSTLSEKQLNFVNTASILVTLTDGGDGNAVVAFNTSGASVGDAYNQANTARNTANAAYGQANNAYTTANNAYNQANNAYTAANNIISGSTQITLKSYRDSIVTNTNVGTANTVDFSTSNWFLYTLTGGSGNRQFTFTNAPSSGTGFTVTMILIQDGSGGKTPTWSNTIYWAGGQVPPATTAASARDLWTFTTYDGGSTFLGTLAVKDAK